METILGEPLKREGLKHYYHVHLLKLTNPIDFQRSLGPFLAAKESTASMALNAVTKARQALLQIWESRRLIDGIIFLHIVIPISPI